MKLVFSIYSENPLDLKDITQKLNIQPSRKALLGDTVYDEIISKESVWEVEYDCKGLGIELLQSDFVNLFQDKVEIIQNLYFKYRFECKVYFFDTIQSDYVPAIFFTKDFISLLCSLNAWVDIDILLNE